MILDLKLRVPKKLLKSKSMQVRKIRMISKVRRRK